MKESIKIFIALGATVIVAGGLSYIFNKKSKGADTKTAAAPKCETSATAERERSNRRHRKPGIARVEINQPEASECNNFISLPDGIIVVTDKGITDVTGAEQQKESGKRRPNKDGGKHRGGRGKKKSGNSYLPHHKELYYLLQMRQNGKLSPEEEAKLDAALKTAKESYNPQESRKSRKHRHSRKRA